MITEVQIPFFLFLAYIIMLILIRLVLLKKGFSFSACPSCKKKVTRTKRNRLLRLTGRLTLGVLSFRIVRCTECEYNGFFLRKFRLKQ